MARKELRRSGGKWLPVLGLVLAAAVVAGYLWLRQGAEPAVQQPLAVAPAMPVEPGNVAGGVIEPPLSLPPPEPPVEFAGEVLPELDDSDAAFGEAVSGLLGEHGGLVVINHLVRRIVVAVDNLPGESLPQARSPLRPPEGSFRVAGEGAAMSIAADNAARYTRYVRLAEALPAERVVALYARFYPLFQAAYEELGYGPAAQFNDRLVAVIDHLLAAPEISGPVALVQPKVRYLFADVRLEGLSAGQKVMIRMGTDNATRVKARLREIRALLAAGGRPGY